MNRPSALTIRARCVANCVEELERHGHTPTAIRVTKQYALICIEYKPEAKTLSGIFRGVVSGSGGRFSVYEIKLYDVNVQWLVPYVEPAQQEKRVH